MRKAMGGLGLLAAMALAGTAIAQGPQPNRQQEKQGSGLFPSKQPAPAYSTSANGAGASLQNPAAAPNAGATGLTGSGANSRGWAAPASGANAGHAR